MLLLRVCKLKSCLSKLVIIVLQKKHKKTELSLETSSEIIFEFFKF